MATQHPTFKQFDRTNTTIQIKGGRALSIASAGVFKLSKQLTMDTEAKQGQGMVLLQDDKNPTDWYLMRDDKNGFTVRMSGVNAQFNAKGLIKPLFESVEFEEPSGVMVVGEKQLIGGKQMWPILTSSLTHRTRKSRK